MEYMIGHVGHIFYITIEHTRGFFDNYPLGPNMAVPAPFYHLDAPVY